MLSPIHIDLPSLSNSQRCAYLHGLQMRGLTAEDFLAWNTLRDKIIAALPHPDCYVREDDEQAFFTSHTGRGGKIIGVFHRAELVAYAMAGFPEVAATDNLGAVMGLDQALLSRVTHLSSCMVLPAWRGLGLQRALLEERLSLARARARPLCMAMVSLHNHGSRRNLLRQGLHIAWTGTIDGLKRHIAMADLQHEHGLRYDMTDERLLPGDDFAALRDAGRQGYAGIAEVRNASGVQLRYVRYLRQG